MLSNDGEMTLFLFSFILASTGSALKKRKKKSYAHISRSIALMEIAAYAVYFRKGEVYMFPIQTSLCFEMEFW